MVLARNNSSLPLHLVVTGESVGWLPALQQIVGPQFLQTRRVRSDQELLDVVRSGQADAAVLDDESPWDIDVLRMLRQVRQLNQELPVVVVTSHTDRQWLELALQLRAYSVIGKPVNFESLLRQIHGMMMRISRWIQEG
jgi:DNA-binding NtrC family response regulator